MAQLNRQKLSGLRGREGLPHADKTALDGIMGLVWVTVIPNRR